MNFLNYFKHKEKTQANNEKFIETEIKRFNDDELFSANKILDEFDVPIEQDVYTKNGKEKQKLSIVGRIVKLAIMVKKSEINTKLDNKIRENMHHATDYQSERTQRDLTEFKYTSLIGKQFKHFKTGNIYMLICFTKDSETLEDMVSYQRVNSDDTTIWSRPFDMFFEKVEKNGEMVDRFELVENQ